MDILTVDNPADAINLHQVSVPIEVEKATITIEYLIESIPEAALGLSAPQIGIFDRVFIARLSDGFYAFVNPTFEVTSAYQFVSREGCLSVPGEYRMLTRAQDIKIGADAIYSIKSVSALELLPDLSKDLSQGDAAIFQHEFDHLEGILITDRFKGTEVMPIPSFSTVSPFLQEATLREVEMRSEKRKKIRQRNMSRKSKQKAIVMNPKRQAKLKKKWKSYNKQVQRSVEIEEYQKAVESGTISDE